MLLPMMLNRYCWRRDIWSRGRTCCRWYGWDTDPRVLLKQKPPQQHQHYLLGWWMCSTSKWAVICFELRHGESWCIDKVFKRCQKLKTSFSRYLNLWQEEGDKTPNNFIFSFTKYFYFSPKSNPILFVLFKAPVTLHFSTLPFFLFLPFKRSQG